MDPHSYVILLLCLLGFFKEFRPSEPFISPYLNGPKNFTQSEINRDIFPVGTYSTMSLLIFVFLLADWFKYKPMILLQGVSGVITWSLLIWTYTIPLMQISQISYGLFCACDVAYSSYLYAKINKENYTKATAHTKAALLLGKSGSGLIGQVLILCHIMDYMQLNYLTLTAILLLTAGTLLLPPITHSYYFHQEKANNDLPLNSDQTPRMEESGSLLDIDKTPEANCNAQSYSLKKMFYLWRDAMQNRQTFKWSVWSALSLCMYLQVSYYLQLLWQELINSGQDDKVYHGFSSSFNTLAGALCTYSVGYITLDWTKYGEITLAATSATQGAVLLGAAYLRTGLIPHYILYAVFKIVYQSSNTIVTAEIAKTLNNQSYALVFGANQFLALVAQSILTILVTEVFELHIQNQFILYGALTCALAVGFAASGAASLCLVTKKINKTDINLKEIEV